MRITNLRDDYVADLEASRRQLSDQNLELQRTLRSYRTGWAITCLAFAFFLWWSMGWQR